MTWFVGRSLLVILMSFALGVAVGWLFWQRRRVRFAQSDAVRSVAARYASVLTEHDAAIHVRDVEIARLNAERHAGLLAAALDEPDQPAPRHPPTPRGGTRPADPSGRTTADDTEDLSLEAFTDAVAALDDRSDEPDGSRETAAVTLPSQAGPAVFDLAAHENLERVEGIGPRIARALRSAGIHTFADLADAELTTLQHALEESGLRFAPSMPTWSRQARLLAAGDEAGFRAFTADLVGGRDVSRNT